MLRQHSRLHKLHGLVVWPEFRQSSRLRNATSMTMTRSLVVSRNARETGFLRTPLSRGRGRSASLHTLVNTSAARKNCGRCEYRFECYPAEYMHELNDLQRIALSVRHALVYEHNSLPQALSWNWKQLMYFCMSLTAGAACYLAIPKLIDSNELATSIAWNHEDRKLLMEYNEGQREEERQHCLEKVNAERPRLLTEMFQLCGCGCGKPIVLSPDKHRGQQQQQQQIQTQGQISNYEIFNGKVWLKDHFHCSVCRKQMQGSVKLEEESDTLHTTAKDESEGLVFERNGKLFCVDDYLESFCDHCALCGKQLGDKLALDPRWGTAYCPDCFDCYQESNKKEASSRSVDALFAALSFEDEEESTTRGSKSSPPLPERNEFDGVVDTQRKLKGLYADVRNWMESEFGITFESDGRPWHVEVKLAEGKQMTQAVVKQSHLAGEPNAVLGLTVKEISSPSLLVQIAERLKGLLFQSGSEHNNQTEERKAHSSHAKVKQVLLSRGLTRTHAGAVLAHELIHCWLALNVCPLAEDTLPHEVEEGLCEIFSYLYLVDSLQHIDKKKKQQSDRKKAKYVEFLLRRMENNNSTAQGKGFHRAFHSLQESHSLRELLEHIKNHKQLPTLKT